MPLCVLLSALAIAIASPVFADEARDESAAALSDLVPESASDVAADLAAIEDFERQMDRELTAEVGRMLDAIVANRTDQQMRWLAQHYFDGAAAAGRVSRGASPVAVVPPANSR
jgi:hypothetical protein